ncbi:HAMP domain-containing sensor histidine kinase [Stenotrophomonas sp. HITSZ_GD]|uniref:sensor histidine kinase n=1 Tax=Stenotrophomonas sp. HITSZ_GD TaxID=3037248 RepID=UPI00240DB1CA|nr:HAMP domain-containing sensor histidine kinase [Stenotrophomonas sp. HITSZ_GD]MDG2524932.1 HAMP domain-containing sensor histidine kinase [Stenotrophomonas sp. HITSZ_GD]
MARKPRALRRQVTLWLVAYAALISLAVFVHGYIVNEQAEQLTWHSLLKSELDHFVQRSAEDPDYHWTDSRTVQLFGDDEDSPPPPAYAGLQPGLHDGIAYEGRDKVLLVQDVNGRRLVLALDITELQQHENRLGLWMVASNLLAIVLLGLLVGWGMGRVVKPLSEMAERIRGLQPDCPGQRVALDPRASSEQTVITEALNDYLGRNDQFVQRERAFINSASHELRTPIAVIDGASELGLAQDDVPAPVRHQLLRIRQTASGVEQLLALLLVLAKDPARLARSSDEVRLDQLLPEIVADHRHLSADKDLRIVLQAQVPARLFAPVTILQAAIGNLLRNAIENSDRGTIHIALSAPATVRIEDPGHGMSPEEISAIYARMARGDQGGRVAGIGLDLIGRLCEHLGWTLSFESVEGRGTIASLDLSSSLVEENAVPERAL